MNSEQIASIEARLAEVEARLEIMDLEAEYARSWDAADPEGWAEVFTSDGVFEMSPVGIQPNRLQRGHIELAAFCRETSTHYRGLHYMHLPRLSINGDVAYARLHFEWIGLYNPRENYRGRRDAAGYYDVTYRKENGRWRMAHRLEKQITGQIADGYDIYLSESFPSTTA
ncbi:nuclear transport factor 2 family protein [Sphingomonas sp. C3-2]|uniref:nuclear transport factor 2 family protein n=1 Tax=Sphingomonas sp. C3-2 TaxID=3062169 RepID=UPI00294AFFB3|nr:nuclear transport factor 2 family protein [Sphingomonas sp. C3-2]WOK37094.1 nuclear transport factor 2 family protein [Sphingomonas sp. C3-2]